MTNAEHVLWRASREVNLSHKVRRQHPIAPYVVDFAIPACKLVIEIDGGQHAEAGDDDKRRSAELKALGYRVMRFWNNEVMENLDGVLQTIVAEVQKTPTSP